MHADLARDRHLRERDREPAVADVVHTGDAIHRARASRRARAALRARSRSASGGMPPSRPCTTAAHSEPPSSGRIAPSTTMSSPARNVAARRALAQLVDQPEHAGDGRGMDVVVARRVVEADVAADDGDAERLARLAHALDDLGELPHHLGVLGVAEVEAVHERDRPRARSTRRCAPLRARPAGRPCADRAGRSAPCRRSTSASAFVVPFTRSTAASAPGPATVFRNSWWSYWRDTHVLSAIVGVASSASSSPERSAPGRELVAQLRRRDRPPATRPAPPGRATGRWYSGPSPRLSTGTSAIGGASDVSAGGSSPIGGVGVLAGHTDRVEQPVVDAKARGVGDAADDRGADLPAPREREHRVEVLGLDDREHALLALRRQRLDRVHAGLALGDARDVDVHARAGLGRGLRRRAREPGRAEILHADRELGVEQLEARLDEPLLLERVADLHRRPLRLVALLERLPTRARSRRRCRRGPVDEPSSTARLPGPSARASTSRSFGRMPRQNTFTSGLPR